MAKHPISKDRIMCWTWEYFMQKRNILLPLKSISPLHKQIIVLIGKHWRLQSNHFNHNQDLAFNHVLRWVNVTNLASSLFFFFFKIDWFSFLALLTCLWKLWHFVLFFLIDQNDKGFSLWGWLSWGYTKRAFCLLIPLPYNVT